jgi:hypothetical protein
MPEGDCVRFVRDRQGNILVATETGTIYRVTKASRTRWTYKSACKLPNLRALNGDEALGLCDRCCFGLRNLHTPIRHGTCGLTSVRFDKANTIYLTSGKFEGGVVAIDHQQPRLAIRTAVVGEFRRSSRDQAGYRVPRGPLNFPLRAGMRPFPASRYAPVPAWEVPHSFPRGLRVERRRR